MNSTKKLLLFLCTLLTIFLISVQANAYERYHWMWSTNKVGFFFDTSTLKFVNNSSGVNIDIIDVWLKSVYSDDAVQEIIDNVESEEIKYALRNYNHRLTHYQINIKTRQIKELEMCLYDSDGNLIHEYPDINNPWKNIIPSSNAEGWVNHILQYISESKETFNVIYRRSL